jgi:hypothetical protein
LVKYHDCRPAIRGNPAIVAPVTEKTLPTYLDQTWRLAAEFVAKASTLVVVGYSLPAYDHLVRDLLRNSVRSRTVIHVFDPDVTVAPRFEALLPTAIISGHPGLPDGTDVLGKLLDATANAA